MQRNKQFVVEMQNKDSFYNKLIKLCVSLLIVSTSVAEVSAQFTESADTVLTIEQLQRGHMNSSLDALSGKTAGVTVGNTSNSEAMLSSVRVRGTNSLTGGNEPLVIIDGMSSDLRTLSSIYPADIESFSILKDASQTAQYGSRGASGVIEVRTKRGRGGAFHISYSGDAGFKQTSKTLKMLTAEQYRALTKQLGLSIVDNGADSDFQQSILQTGFVQNHHIAFGGGADKTSYRASISFSQNNSIIKNIGDRNFTAKVDVTQKAFSDYLTIDFGAFGATGYNRFINNEQDLFYSAAAFNPTFPTNRNSSGTWDGYADASQIGNPGKYLDINKQRESMHFNTHLKLSADLTHGFSVTAYGSYSYASNNRSYFFPTYVENTGMIYRGTDKIQSWLTNLQAGYQRDFSGHKLNVALLAELQGVDDNEFHTTVNRLASDAFGFYNLSVGGMRKWEGTGSAYEQSQLASFMAQASYNALNRYELNITMRADGSSKVGSKNRWGFFPSVSGSWSVHNEPFMTDVNWLSKLKLNVGFGVSGNLAGINSYNTLQLLTPIGVVDENGIPTVVMSYANNANPDLKWEKQQTSNVSIDFGLLKNRIVIEAEYYYSLISDMLYNYTVSVPPFIYNKLLANLGSMSNQGVEIGIGIAAVQTKDFDFNISANITWQKNKLLSLDGYWGDQYLTAPTYTPIGNLNGAGLHGGNTNVVYQIVGQPLGVFYLPHCTGLKQETDGTYTYEIEDIDGNSVIDMSENGDRRIAGQATPKVLLGSNFSFRYKQFDLSLQINGAFGHKIFNGTSLSYMNLGSLPFYNVLQDAEKTGINDLTVSDYWLENGDYINFDYLTLGWTYPLNEKYALKSIRLALSVNNLGTITGYSGLTPMINSTVVDSTLGIDDKRSYPVYQTYSLALSLNF